MRFFIWHCFNPLFQKKKISTSAEKNAGAGVLTSHHYLAAALLALQPEHNAATPT
jgi:hypothetical protein